MTLEEELAEQYRMKGVDTALTHYEDLKKKYLEKGAYDFSERPLNIFGYEVLEKKDNAGAIRVFMLNAMTFPKSAKVWDSLAEAYMKAGDTKLAKRYYERSLKLDPNNVEARES
jgi:Flp pilus assembly protein TadD